MGRKEGLGGLSWGCGRVGEWRGLRRSAGGLQGWKGPLMLVGMLLAPSSVMPSPRSAACNWCMLRVLRRESGCGIRLSLVAVRGAWCVAPAAELRWWAAERLRAVRSRGAEGVRNVLGCCCGSRWCAQSPAADRTPAAAEPWAPAAGAARKPTPLFAPDRMLACTSFSGPQAAAGVDACAGGADACCRPAIEVAAGEVRPLPAAAAPASAARACEAHAPPPLPPPPPVVVRTRGLARTREAATAAEALWCSQSSKAPLLWYEWRCGEGRLLAAGDWFAGHRDASEPLSARVPRHPFAVALTRPQLPAAALWPPSLACFPPPPRRPGLSPGATSCAAPAGSASLPLPDGKRRRTGTGGAQARKAEDSASV